MEWPYRFQTLTPEQVQARRQTLDRYALYAQLTTLLPALILAVTRLVLKRMRHGSSSEGRGFYDAVPSKNRRRGIAGRLEQTARTLSWWLDNEVSVLGWNAGTTGQWIVGVTTAAWLLMLCVLETGDDYLHLTKRFGVVAISLFPLQYALTLKSFSPFSWLLASSHEHINQYHRILARVTSLLILLHACFYLNYFDAVGILGRRLFEADVFVGFLAFEIMLLMYSVSMGFVRRWSYRVFFVIHLGAAFAIPILILFHAKAARLFVIEALAVFVIDLAVRKYRTISTQTSIEAIPGTDLVKITAAIPRSRIAAFSARPGGHVYVSIPNASRPADAALGGALYELMLNPFTVAAVDESASEITLVARAPLNGPLTGRLAALASAPTNTSVANIPLDIEGPYGAASRKLDDLIGPSVDHILLVAGGVGATFAVPMYRAAVAENPHAKVELVWAVRTAGEATWALSPLSTSEDPSAPPAWSNVLDDPNVRIFLTGDYAVAGDPMDLSRRQREESVASTSSDPVNAEVELNAVHRDRAGSTRRGASRRSERQRKRPDLRKIVDEAFRKNADDRVAVMVCGPAGMARELRDCVSPWVAKGREVEWHNESFGW